MIVVADTTPLNYLILIDEIDALPALFSSIVVPVSVIDEMIHRKAPDSVRNWAQSLPSWVEVRTETIMPTFTRGGLGKGETSAIALAIELNLDGILMDDKKAILEASDKGLKVITTFLVLEMAAFRGLLSLDTAIESLSKTNFHFPPEHVLDEILRRYRK